MSTPTMKEALEDCQSHYDAWRKAIGYALDRPLNDAYRSYLEYEIEAFDRTFRALVMPTTRTHLNELCKVVLTKEERDQHREGWGSEIMDVQFDAIETLLHEKHVLASQGHPKDTLPSPSRSAVTETEAERLANWLTRLDVRTVDKILNCVSAAAELRRLGADNKELTEKLAALPAQHEPVAQHRDLHSHMMVVAHRAADAVSSNGQKPTSQKEFVRAICTAIQADKNLLAKLAPQAQQEPLMVDIHPPATQRDRWMYEQGRLAERDPRSHAPQAQPAREWVGLTEEEKTELRRKHYPLPLLLMDATEAKLKEKNT